MVPCIRIPQRLYKRKTTLGFSRILEVSLRLAGREAENPAASDAAATATNRSFLLFFLFSPGSSFPQQKPPPPPPPPPQCLPQPIQRVTTRTRLARVCSGEELLPARFPLPINSSPALSFFFLFKWAQLHPTHTHAHLLSFAEPSIRSLKCDRAAFFVFAGQSD